MIRRSTTRRLATLQGLSNLEMLSIYRTGITDAGAASFVAMQRLHTLQMNDTNLTNASLPLMEKLPRLHCMDLAGTQVTAVGLSRLSRYPNLQSLALDGKQVTEESVPYLKNVRGLFELYPAVNLIAESVHVLGQGRSQLVGDLAFCSLLRCRLD